MTKIQLDDVEGRDVSIQKVGPRPHDWSITRIDGTELPPIKSFELKFDTDQTDHPQLTLEVCRVGQLQAELPARWKVDHATLKAMAADSGYKLVLVDEPQPGRTLYVTSSQCYKDLLAEQLMGDMKRRNRHRSDSGSIMVITPHDSLTGHRFDTIYVSNSVLHSAPSAEFKNRQRWLEEELPLKLVPGGRLIWF